MAAKKTHRTTQPKARTDSFGGELNQGGPISIEESAPNPETKLSEVKMDTQDVENAKNKALETAENIAERAGMNKEQTRGAAREWTGKAERAYGNVKSKVSEAADDLSSNYGEASDEAANSWDRALSLVQDNPGAAVGVSVLVGAGLGALIAYLSRD